jgi:two-component sensor histidine kinase
MRATVLNVAFWTLFGVFQGSMRVLPIGDRYPYPGRLNAIALIVAYLWALLTPPIFRLAAWVIAGQRVRAVRVALVVVLGVLVAGLAAVAVGATQRLLLPGSPGTRHWLSMWEWEWIWAQRRWAPQQLVTFIVVLVAGVVSHMSRRYRAREREAADLQAEASRLEAEQAELRARTAQLQAESAELHAQLAEARLAMLRARLNPHFLFNTLNAVSALVAQDPRGVRTMIALLGELLRHALADGTEQEIPLREELRLLRLYLEILEIRYQGQLRTAVTVDPDVQEALVPNLILQPLVENAMKHGIDPAGGHGAIEVLAHRAGDDLVLTVRDTGPGDPGSGDGAGASAGPGGVGLQLTRGRLAELYGAEQRLELTPASDGGMTARIVLPYHTAEDVRVAEEVTVP